MAVVNYEVAAITLQRRGAPALLDGPSAGSARDSAAAYSDLGESRAAADQDIAARDHVRLHDAVDIPLVLPEQLAVGRGDADRSLPVQQENLSDAVDRRELW